LSISGGRYGVTIRLFGGIAVLDADGLLKQRRCRQWWIVLQANVIHNCPGGKLFRGAPLSVTCLPTQSDKCEVAWQTWFSGVGDAYKGSRECHGIRKTFAGIEMSNPIVRPQTPGRQLGRRLQVGVVCRSAPCTSLSVVNKESERPRFAMGEHRSPGRRPLGNDAASPPRVVVQAPWF